MRLTMVGRRRVAIVTVVMAVIVTLGITAIELWSPIAPGWTGVRIVTGDCPSVPCAVTVGPAPVYNADHTTSYSPSIFIATYCRARTLDLLLAPGDYEVQASGYTGYAQESYFTVRPWLHTTAKVNGFWESVGFLGGGPPPPCP